MFEYMQAMTSETVVTFNRVRNSVMQERNSRRGRDRQGVLAGSVDATNLLEGLGYRADDTHIGYVAWSVSDRGAGEVGEPVRRRLAALAHSTSPCQRGWRAYRWFTPISLSAYSASVTSNCRPAWGVAFGAPGPGSEGFRHTPDEALLSARGGSAGEQARLLPGCGSRDTRLPA